MTPKEKAIELVDRYNKLYGNEIGNYLDFDDAKECALVAVHELIESHLLLTTTHEPEPSIRCKRYWQEVKKEIKKL